MIRAWERRDCVSTEIEGSLVLLDLETLKYHALNQTAAAVWEMLTVARGDDFLVESLCRRYQVTPAHCRESVGHLLQTLAASGLVKQVESASGAPADLQH